MLYEAVIAILQSGRRTLHVTNYGRCVFDANPDSIVRVAKITSRSLSVKARHNIKAVCDRLSTPLFSHLGDAVFEAHAFTICTLVGEIIGDALTYARTQYALYIPAATPKLTPARVPRLTPVRAPRLAPTTILTTAAIAAMAPTTALTTAADATMEAVIVDASLVGMAPVPTPIITVKDPSVAWPRREPPPTIAPPRRDPVSFQPWRTTIAYDAFDLDVGPTCDEIGWLF